MWIAKKRDWDKSHTDLSKYFIEKIKQRVDYEESISNRHRTTNGYTLIAEIIEVGTLTQKRIKSIHRLLSLLKEANSEILSSSLKNDFILKKYHSDIIDYYNKLNINKIKENGNNLSELINRSKIHFLRLEKEYYQNLILETEKINFDSIEFKRNALLIDGVIESLIPYLLHIGYSVTSISDISYSYIKKKFGNRSSLRIIKNFSNSVKRYCFLLRVESKYKEINSILDYLSTREVHYEIVTKENISTFLLDDFNVSETETLYLIKHSTLDPHNYLRNIYEMGLKNYVSIKDRFSLQFFTDFFERVYWKFDKPTHKFQKSSIALDPINVPKRKSTLFDTLETVKKSYDFDFSSEDGLPKILEIRDSLYYYNLSLGSKSIENSLSLLWTSLETLLPYRLKSNDIENVQHFVSKSLSIGSIGRELTSFALRFNEVNKANRKCFKNLDITTSEIDYAPEKIKKWIEWLSIEHEPKNDSDPFNIIQKNSNLLCHKYCFLNDTFTGKEDVNVEYWLNKIQNSQNSIQYQLDRIYLHRNQIVHSGKFINEYSNLWNHLEWYVGKLLAFAVIKYLELKDKSQYDKVGIFMQLEADVDSLTHLLKKNKDKKIKDISFSFSAICKESWQFF